MISTKLFMTKKSNCCFRINFFVSGDHVNPYREMRIKSEERMQRNLDSRSRSSSDTKVHQPAKRSLLQGPSSKKNHEKEQKNCLPRFRRPERYEMN